MLTSGFPCGEPSIAAGVLEVSKPAISSNNDPGRLPARWTPPLFLVASITRTGTQEGGIP
eukprot:10034288-Lingulodinium_polyedra.AAC.1